MHFVLVQDTSTPLSTYIKWMPVTIPEGTYEELVSPPLRRVTISLPAV